MRKPFISNPVYRLFNTDPVYTNLALTRLASAPNTPREASYNALVAREHEDVLNTLKRMNPKRIEKLASMCPDVVTYSIDLKIFAKQNCGNGKSRTKIFRANAAAPMDVET